MIGHSELIIKTEFLQQMPTHDEHYGHDWALIFNMANSGKHKKATTGKAKFNCIFLFYGLGLLLILSRIPWKLWF